MINKKEREVGTFHWALPRYAIKQTELMKELGWGV